MHNPPLRHQRSADASFKCRLSHTPQVLLTLRVILANACANSSSHRYQPVAMPATSSPSQACGPTDAFAIPAGELPFLPPLPRRTENLTRSPRVLQCASASLAVLPRRRTRQGCSAGGVRLSALISGQLNTLDYAPGSMTSRSSVTKCRTLSECNCAEAPSKPWLPCPPSCVKQVRKRSVSPTRCLIVIRA